MVHDALPLRATLRSGEPVLIREIGPADRPLLRDGFEKLSSQSRFFRFLSAHGELSEAELDRFTEQNTDDHFAIGAAAIGTDADLPLATARFVRLDPKSTEAEFAITIIDSHQRLGLGTLMLRTLALSAQARNIAALVALIHRENAGMRVLLERFGGFVRSGGAEEEWCLPLPLPKENPALSVTGFVAIPNTA